MAGLQRDLARKQFGPQLDGVRSGGKNLRPTIDRQAAGDVEGLHCGANCVLHVTRAGPADLCNDLACIGLHHAVALGRGPPGSSDQKVSLLDALVSSNGHA